MEIVSLEKPWGQTSWQIVLENLYLEKTQFGKSPEKTPQNIAGRLKKNSEKNDREKSPMETSTVKTLLCKPFYENLPGKPLRKIVSEIIFMKSPLGNPPEENLGGKLCGALLCKTPF